MLLESIVLLQPRWLRTCRTYDMYCHVNGHSNRGLIGIITRDTANYSCFNAFSRVDMRVEVKIPGGVKTHVIDERGTKYELILRESHRIDKKQLINYGSRHTCQA